eukprot:c37698_g1_i1 orf=3-233(-)
MKVQIHLINMTRLNTVLACTYMAKLARIYISICTHKYTHMHTLSVFTHTHPHTHTRMHALCLVKNLVTSYPLGYAGL